MMNNNSKTNARPEDRRRSLQNKFDLLAIAIAPDILACVGGDPGRIDALIELLQSGFDYAISTKHPEGDPGEALCALHPRRGRASTDSTATARLKTNTRKRDFTKKEDLP